MKCTGIVLAECPLLKLPSTIKYLGQLLAKQWTCVSVYSEIEKKVLVYSENSTVASVRSFQYSSKKKCLTYTFFFILVPSEIHPFLFHNQSTVKIYSCRLQTSHGFVNRRFHFWAEQINSIFQNILVICKQRK